MVVLLDYVCFEQRSWVWKILDGEGEIPVFVLLCSFRVGCLMLINV